MVEYIRPKPSDNTARTALTQDIVHRWISTGNDALSLSILSSWVVSSNSICSLELCGYAVPNRVSWLMSKKYPKCSSMSVCDGFSCAKWYSNSNIMGQSGLILLILLILHGMARLPIPNWHQHLVICYHHFILWTWFVQIQLIESMWLRYRWIWFFLLI